MYVYLFLCKDIYRAKSTLPIFCVKNVNFLEFIRKEWDLGKSIAICAVWMLGWRMKGEMCGLKRWSCELLSQFGNPSADFANF